jgi:hypothetical protein
MSASASIEMLRRDVLPFGQGAKETAKLTKRTKNERWRENERREE